MFRPGVKAMHEYPAARRIVEVAVDRAAGRRVKAVTLLMGDDCGYHPDSIAMFFELLSEGTVCEGATLRVERAPSLLRCTGCGLSFARAPFSFDCPHCGAPGAPGSEGREFLIRTVEVEEYHEGTASL